MVGPPGEGLGVWFAERICCWLAPAQAAGVNRQWLSQLMRDRADALDRLPQLIHVFSE